MAIYHLHVKNISRGDGRSVVAAAAYRAGEALWNQAEEKISHFGGERRVVHQSMRLPDHAPSWMADRTRFWNALEAASKRSDARFAKEIEAALPRELEPQQWIAIVEAMVGTYTQRGIVADVAIHDDSTKHNPHVHILLSNLSVAIEGFGRANRDLIKKDFLTEARRLWRELVNSALGNAGHSARIDERSYKERGIDRDPTAHRGPDPAERQANRDALQGRGRAMNLESELIEARKEMLRAPDVKDRFPLLAARPDWPPVDKHMPPGLSHYEKVEFAMFWREVASHALGDRDRQPSPTPSHVPQEASVRPAPVQQRRPQTEPLQDRLAALRKSFPEWEALHHDLMERMKRGGLRTDGPLDDFQSLKETMQRFEVRLQEIQDLRAENVRLRAQWAEWERRQARDLPVPDPNGEPISQQALERAQDAMLAEHRKPDQPNLRAPRPDEINDRRGRAAAQAEVDRENRRAVPEMPERAAYRPSPAREAPPPAPQRTPPPPGPTRSAGSSPERQVQPNPAYRASPAREAPPPAPQRTPSPPGPTRSAGSSPERQVQPTRAYRPSPTREAPPPAPQRTPPPAGPTRPVASSPERQMEPRSPVAPTRPSPPSPERKPSEQSPDRRLSMDDLLRQMADHNTERQRDRRSPDDDRDY